MTCFNVQGLRTKIYTLIDYLTDYHIIILLETFIEEKDIAKSESRLADKYDYTWIPSKRDNVRGRSEGGIMMAIDKKLDVKNIEIFAQEWIVKADIKINDKWTKVIGGGT